MSCVMMGLMVASVLAGVHQNAAQHQRCDELYNIGTGSESGGKCVIHDNVVSLDGGLRVVIKTFTEDAYYVYELEHTVLLALTQNQDPDGRDTWLPRVYSSCIMPGKTHPSLVMEFVPNRFEFFYAASLDGLVDFLHQLLWAVARLHQLGYSHNDLTVDNLRITDTGLVKLVDFAMAKGMTEQIAEEGAYGTGVYMPPEISRRKIENHFNAMVAEMPISPIDVGRLDCWPLGIIAFYILTGGHVYNSDELLQMENGVFDVSESTEVCSDLRKYGRYFYIKETIMKQPQTSRTAQEMEILDDYKIIGDYLDFSNVDTVQNRFKIQLNQRFAGIEQFGPNLTNIVDNLWTLVNSLLQFENSARASVHDALENPIFQYFIGQAVIQQRNSVFTT